MPISLNGSTGIQFPDSSLQGAAASPFGLKNRIINGDMRIDQRNAGASYTTLFGVANYTLDRWRASVQQSSKFSIQQNAGSVTPPVGFTNYLGCTSLSAYTVGASENFDVRQIIEGFNIADLAWGTANAKTVTLSFWVYSSLTGTFGGALRNSATDRSYPFSYSIPTANTWTQISITILGDTTGTWLTTNGTGIILTFGLGVGSTVSGTAGAWAAGSFISATGATSVVGTNGATLYITGVQLEQNTSATPFERRLYSVEYDMCRRYCEVYSNPNLNYDQDGFPQGIQGVDLGGRGEIMIFYYPKRTSPTITALNNNLYWQNMANTGSTCTFSGALIGTGINAAPLFFGVSGACAVNALSGIGNVIFTNVANKIIISAEL